MTGQAHLATRVAGHDDAVTAAELLATGLVNRGAEAIHSLLDAGGLCLMTFADGELAGVGTAIVLSDLAEAIPIGHDDLVHVFPDKSPVGIVKQLVTLPAARGQGIAREFVSRQVDWMRARGAQMAWSDAWVYPDGLVPASWPLIANGFDRFRREPGFWTLESIEMGYRCVECGNPCHCAADIFTLDLTEAKK